MDDRGHCNLTQESGINYVPWSIFLRFVLVCIDCLDLYIVLNLNGRMNLLKLLPQPNQTAVAGKMRQSRPL